MKRNKRVKQMMADVYLQGRKAVFFGEETEIFAANSYEQLAQYFDEHLLDDEDNVTDYFGVISRSWRYWWSACVNEKENGVTGAPVYRKDGSINKDYVLKPLLSGLYGGADTIAQVGTSYN